MPRNIRCGLVQTKCDISPEMPISDIRAAMVEKHGAYVKEAADKGVRMLCFQELMTGPYFPAEEDPRWYNLAEPVPDGPTIQRMRELAKKHGVALIIPLYEREMSGVYYNTRIERFQSETNKFCGEIKGGFDGINRDIESKKQSYEQLMKSQIEMKESNLQTKQLLESLQEKIISLEKQCAQSQTKLTQQYNLLLQQKKEPQIPDGLLRDFEGQAKEIIQSDSQIQKEIRYIFLIWIITFFMLVIMIASH